MSVVKKDLNAAQNGLQHRRLSNNLSFQIPAAPLTSDGVKRKSVSINDETNNQRRRDSKLHAPVTAEDEDVVVIITRDVVDRYNLALIIMGALGFGSLLPFNIFCTAAEYFNYQFRNRNNPNETTYLQETYESTVSVANPLIGLLFSVFSTYLTKTFSFQSRISISLVVMFLLYAFTACFAVVNTDAWQTGFFILTLGCVAVAAASGSVVCSSALGVASFLPPVFITSTLVGMALAGVFTSLTNIISISLSPNRQFEGLVYFIIASLASGATLALFVVFNRLDFVKHHVHRVVTAERRHSLGAQQTTTSVHVSSSTSNLIDDPHVVRSQLTRVQELRQIIRLSWHYCISIILVFFVTLALFPSIESKARSLNVEHGPSIQTTYFVPVFTFLCFNVFDAVGRYGFNALLWPRATSRWTPYVTLLLAIVRIVFIPLMLLCNIQPRGSQASVLFGDAVYVVLSVLFAVTNGYVAGIASMYPPQGVPEHLKETCGSLMITSQFVGLLSGGLTSFLLLYIVSRL